MRYIMSKKILLLVLILFCLLMTSCKKNNDIKLTESEIRDILEKDNPSSLKLVDTITFASDSAAVNDLEIKINGEEIVLGDYVSSIQGYNNKQIIGYYDESGQTYYFYRLATNLEGVNSVWQFAGSKNDDFEQIGWISAMIDNPDELVLVKFNKIDGVNDGNYRQYRVYAIANQKLVLVE